MIKYIMIAVTLLISSSYNNLHAESANSFFRKSKEQRRYEAMLLALDAPCSNVESTYKRLQGFTVAKDLNSNKQECIEALQKLLEACNEFRDNQTYDPANDFLAMNYLKPHVVNKAIEWALEDGAELVHEQLKKEQTSEHNDKSVDLANADTAQQATKEYRD